jgi:hypothetical protein
MPAASDFCGSALRGFLNAISRLRPPDPANTAADGPSNVFVKRQPTQRSRLGLAAVLGFLALEFLLFDQVGARQHTVIHPRWNDQIQYLTEAYTGWQYASRHGLLVGLGEALVNPSAQGTLHDFFTTLLFAVAGPSRSAALAVNMLYVIAWQASLFAAVKRASGSTPLAWIALAMPLCLAAPWTGSAGSAVDFRLDLMAGSAMGIALSLALATDRFRRGGWSIAFGVAVGFALLTRFLTGAYFALIYAGLLGWALSAAADRGRRAGNVLLSAAVAAALAAPVFWINRNWVYDYYFIGHFTGPESAIRSPNFGLGRSLTWLVTQFARQQLGVFFGCVAAFVSCVLLGGAWASRSNAARPDTLRDFARASLIPGSTFLVAPALVLTLHAQKSEYVLGVIAPGLIVLLLGFWSIGLPTFSPRRQTWIATAAVASAAIFFALRMFERPSAHLVRDARKVSALADYVLAHARAAEIANPRVAVDRVTDCLDAQVLRVICYERKKIWVPFVMTLPTGIAEEREELLQERLESSDFVFITEEGGSTSWPYDRQMLHLGPQHRAWCEENLRPVERFEIFGARMVLYQRPQIP